MTSPVPLRTATGVPKPLPDPRHQAAHDFLRQAMRLNIGRGRRFSAEQVGEALGVKTRLVEAIRDGEQEPRFGLGLAIAALMGPATFNGMIALVGFTGAFPISDRRACALKTVAEMGQAIAALSSAMAHGTPDVDRDEAPTVMAELFEAFDAMSALIAELRERHGDAVAALPLDQRRI